MQRTFSFIAATALVVSSFGVVAKAAPFVELGDAGAFPQGPQATTGLGTVNSITGTIPAVNDVDSFLINITNPAAFSATTVPALPGGIADTTLYLFNTTGTGIASNDDTSAAQFNSTLPVGNALYSGLTPGLYVVSVSSFGFIPFRVATPTVIGENIFDVNDFTGVKGPVAASAGLPVLSYANVGTDATAIGAYTITLTGASFSTQVPEPTSLSLLGLGGLALLRRKR